MADQAVGQAWSQPDLRGRDDPVLPEIKSLFGQALRQTLGLARLDWLVRATAQSAGTKRRCRPSSPTVPVPSPCSYWCDSTGVKFLGDGECMRKNHSAEYRYEWRKVHLHIDAQTLEIRAVEVTSNAIGDAPMLPELLAQIPPEEPIDSVGADGAYDTRARRDATAQRGAVAVLAPRKNAHLWRRPSPGSESRNEAVRACLRLGYSVWKTWSGYYRCSLVDTKMHCIKRRNERVTVRTFERQVVELHGSTDSVRSAGHRPCQWLWH
jgi:hypothetical protein